MQSRLVRCAAGLLMAACSASLALANDDFKCIARERTGVAYEGKTIKHVTYRCARRVTTGITMTCDSGEYALGFYCRLHGSASGGYTALVSTGITGPRSAACVWSALSDVSITLRCKRVAPLKNDSRSDEYNE